MADTKTFKDIDKKLQKLVDETKENFKITKSWQRKLDDHATGLIEKAETDRKPRAKVQKEMLRVLETQESQDKVRSRDTILANFKMGKATLAELKAAKLSKQDFVKSGFGDIGSNIEMMRQWWQDGIGSFSQTVKQWWKNVKENSKVLQAAKQFWNSEAIKKAREFATHVGGIINSHMSEILGEFQEVFDTLKRFFGVVWDSIKGAFQGLFGGNKEAQKEKREEKMVNHLQKIKEGIGFLVKGEKIEDISSVKKGKGGFLDKILNFLGFSGLAVGGAAALLGGLKLAAIGLVTKFVLSSIKEAIKGWREDGLRGALTGFFTEITSLPRKILGWIGEKILNYFGANGSAFREALSDENMKKWTNNVINAVTSFVEDLTNFVQTLFFQIKDGMINHWNNLMPDWMPKGATGSGENLTKAQEQFKRAKNFQTGTKPGAQNVLSILELANKSAKQAESNLKLRKDRGENVDKQVQELKKLNDNISELKETNVQIQNQSNNVQSGAGPGSSGIVDPDLWMENSARNWGGEAP